MPVCCVNDADCACCCCALAGGGLGKKVNNDVTRQLLGGWAPKYNSFKQFFMDGGKDYYNSSGMF
jgi:hypothetical protein